MNKAAEVEKLVTEGLELLQKGKNKKALEIFEKAISLDATNTLAWNNKGVALRKMGKVKEALECYNKALELDPEFSIAMLNKARSLKLLKKFDLALFAYEDVLDLHPNHPEAEVESERVRALIARRTKISEELSEERLQEKEDQLLKERKNELQNFLEENRQNINDSIIKIAELYTHGIKEEAQEQREKLSKAIIRFNDQLIEKIENISKEFVTLDFEEEIRTTIDEWTNFKDQQLEKLAKLS